MSTGENPRTSGRGDVKIEVTDCGAGEYLVLHAGHWAIDSREAADELHAILLKMLAGCRDD